MALPEKQCPACSQWFTPKRSRVTCCSRRCKSLIQWEKTPEESPQHYRQGCCRHCQRTTALAGRGLCYRCWRDAHVRMLYPPGKRGPKRVLDQATGEPFRPEQKACLCCGAFFRPDTARSRYCSHRCHKTHWWSTRKRQVGPAIYPPSVYASLLDEQRPLAFREISRFLGLYGYSPHYQFPTEDLLSVVIEQWLLRLPRYDAALQARCSIQAFLCMEARWAILDYVKKERPKNRPRILVSTEVLENCSRERQPTPRKGGIDKDKKD